MRTLPEKRVFVMGGLLAVTFIEHSHWGDFRTRINDRLQAREMEAQICPSADGQDALFKGSH